MADGTSNAGISSFHKVSCQKRPSPIFSRLLRLLKALFRRTTEERASKAPIPHEQDAIDPGTEMTKWVLGRQEAKAEKR